MADAVEKNSGEFEKLFGELRKKLITEKSIIAVIVFGSAARGEADKRSDVDICIVLKKKDSKIENMVGDRVLDVEKKFDRNIQIIFADEFFSGVNRNLLESILMEGKPIIGRMPEISVQKLELEPYAIIKYNLESLPQSNKMIIKRGLYGQKTTKKYKGKIYKSEKKGLVKEFSAERIGIASIMVPKRNAAVIKKFLEQQGATVREINIWVSKP